MGRDRRSYCGLTTWHARQRATDARQRQLLYCLVNITVALEVRGASGTSESAAPEVREASIESRPANGLQPKVRSHGQCAELNASTNELVAIRSANRISSAGVIAMTTLPMRSAVNAESCERR